MTAQDPVTDLNQLREHATEAARLLRALSNESRLMILCSLAAGELSVTELNDRIELSQSGLSQQLAILRREGYVATRREAQTIYYRLAPSNALRVIHLLKDMYCS
ncbi:MAG: winged helix-turn-helix transcriptional regulator [Pseudomonadales bacterium]|nr:winged helix-turn-helix transcriptional regulator [Pseudomonadales bacterium]